MSRIPPDAISHLQSALEEPDLQGTRYKIERLLGEGGMGSVWLARDSVFDRNVAIKVVRGLAAGTEITRRLRTEALTIAQLEHPAIVPIYDIGELSEGRVFYVMKVVEGVTLAEWSKGAASINDRLRLFARLCETMAYAHERGVIHRDLKPENIMVGKFGELYVMDWGIAKSTAASGPPTGGGDRADNQSTSITSHGTIMGTPGYMAPEQARGDSASADNRTDIYALGRVLAFLIGGSPTSLLKPRPLAAIASAASAPDPEDRYKSAGEFARDVTRILDADRPLVYKENLFETSIRWIDKNRFLVWMLVAYVVLRIAIWFISGH